MGWWMPRRHVFSREEAKPRHARGVHDNKWEEPLQKGVREKQRACQQSWGGHAFIRTVLGSESCVTGQGRRLLFWAVSDFMYWTKASCNPLFSGSGVAWEPRVSSSGLSYTKRRGVRVGGVYRDLPSDAAKLRKNLPVFIVLFGII